MAKRRWGSFFLRSLTTLLFSSLASNPISSSAFVLAHDAAVGTAKAASREQPLQTATTTLFAESPAYESPCTEDDNNSPLASTKLDKYHLFWSPGAWKKVVVGTATLFLAHAAGQGISQSAIDLTTAAAPTFLTTLATNVVLPLLASACCLLQLGLNLLSVGCAGFNTVLGPVRPYFISLLLYLTVVSRFSKHGHHTSIGSWAAATVLRWGLALLPEALHLWNNRDDIYERIVPKRKLAATNPYKLQAVVELEIPTMGCVACINKIDKALRQVGDQVLTAKSTLHEASSGGQAHVQIAANSHSEIHATVASLTDAVNKAGFFGSTVESVKIENNKKT